VAINFDLDMGVRVLWPSLRFILKNSFSINASKRNAFYVFAKTERE
jgi:hypothetical protein